MNRKVLFVDDEEDVLKGYTLLLQRHFEVRTALGARAGLSLLKKDDPFAIIVSDFQMPGMNGVEFLKLCQQLSPVSVRIMLTGQANFTDALKAVNEGHIFQFLQKPCHFNVLSRALNAGFEQFQLIQAEKELLEKTLKGVVKMLMEILAMENPTVFSRTTRVCHIMRRMGGNLEKCDILELELSGLLSQIGCITLSQETIERHFNGEPLSDLEQQQFFKHPQIAQHLLANIPRLGSIGLIIGSQYKNFDGSGSPDDKIRGEKIPLGARILRIALDFDTIVQGGVSDDEGILRLHQKAGVLYDPHLVAIWENELLGKHEAGVSRTIAMSELYTGMILGQTLFMRDGRVLLARGQEITDLLRARLLNIGPTHNYLPATKIVVICPTNKSA